MVYPTMEEVEAADRVQLGKWFRFLPSAGGQHVSNKNFAEEFRKEKAIMERIITRFDEEGGWDTWLSKLIGWTEI